MGFTDRVVDLLDLAEEGIEIPWERVRRSPEREVAAGAQECVSLLVADRRIDPVPSGRCIDEVEALGFTLPILERLDVDLNRHPGQVAARNFCEVCSDFDAH